MPDNKNYASSVISREDIHNIIEAQRGAVRQDVPYDEHGRHDYDSPLTKEACQKIDALNFVLHKIINMMAAPRYANDEAQAPILRDSQSDEGKTDWLCPVCGCMVGEHTHNIYKKETLNDENFCPDCGLRLDWDSVCTKRDVNLHTNISLKVDQVMDVLNELENRENEIDTQIAINLRAEFIKRIHPTPVSATVAKKPILQTDQPIACVDYTDGGAERMAYEWKGWVCPVCEWFVEADSKTSLDNLLFHIIGQNPADDESGNDASADKTSKHCHFCPSCGQKIDWDEISPII